MSNALTYLLMIYIMTSKVLSSVGYTIQHRYYVSHCDWAYLCSTCIVLALTLTHHTFILSFESYFKLSLHLHSCEFSGTLEIYLELCVGWIQAAQQY